LSNSGGDGIYIGRSVTNGLHSKNIEIRNCISDNNYRQGISITNAENISIEDCIVKNSSGVHPKAGILFEPNTGDILRNCQVKNCIAENNAGAGFRVQLSKLSEFESVDILFENCLVKSGGIGLQVGSVKDGNLSGLIKFKNCTVENTYYPGIYVHDKSTKGAGLKFENCSVRNSGNGYWYPKTALLLSKNDTTPTEIFGGIEFVDCSIFEEPHRLPLLIEPTVEKSKLQLIVGTLKVYDPTNTKSNMGSSIENTSIEIEYFQ
jgi:hypothetical protein